MNGIPSTIPRGVLAPTRCFCNELKAIIPTLTKETTEKPKNAVRNNINKSKRKTPSDPEIIPAIKIATPSPVKRINAWKRAAFKYCLKTSLWFHPSESKYSKTPLFLSYT